MMELLPSQDDLPDREEWAAWFAILSVFLWGLVYEEFINSPIWEGWGLVIVAFSPMAVALYLDHSVKGGSDD